MHLKRPPLNLSAFDGSVHIAKSGKTDDGGLPPLRSGPTSLRPEGPRLVMKGVDTPEEAMAKSETAFIKKARDDYELACKSVREYIGE